MYDMNKSITDRAYTDVGTALFYKGANGKYKFALCVTNMPATGSAPEQQEKTVTTDRKKTYVPARQDNPQKEYGVFAHRDNFRIMKKLAQMGTVDFLQLNPDFTGNRFSGSVAMYQDEVSVGNNATAKMVVTVSDSDEFPLDNVADLIEDTVVFDGAVPEEVRVVGVGTNEFTVSTLPADATLAAVSETTGVATVKVSGKKVTVTGVTAGTAIIELTASKEGYSDMKRTVLVVSTTA